MRTYNVKPFVQIEILEKIKPENLIAFFTPYAAYLKERNFSLLINANENIEYEQLAAILMSPTQKTPPKMVEALYFIQEMSEEEHFDDLHEQAHAAHLEGAEECTTAADLAILLWLHSPERLKRIHAEVLALPPKSFLCFQAKKIRTPGLLDPSIEQQRSLKKDIEQWFLQNKRGKANRLLVVPSDGEHKTYFLVKREGKMEGGKWHTIAYRPECYDCVIYDSAHNELAICNTSRAKKEQDMYLSLFGQHFFEDTEYFSQEDKYTLAPLREIGADALACADIPGMQEVKLTEIQVQFCGPWNDRQIYTSRDFFGSLSARDSPFPSYGELISACFSITFEAEQRPRNVRIETPNVVNFDRTGDFHVIEIWLRKRGFVVEHKKDKEEAHIALFHAALARSE